MSITRVVLAQSPEPEAHDKVLEIIQIEYVALSLNLIQTNLIQGPTSN